MTIIIVIIVFVIIFLIAISSKKKVGSSTSIPAKTIEKDADVLSLNLSLDESITNEGCYLVVDTETTGLPKSKYAAISDSENWPFVLQMAWALLDKDFKCIEVENHYLDFKGDIPFEATKVNHITKSLIKEKGEPTLEVLSKFIGAAKRAKYLVAHNAAFDIPVIIAELFRNDLLHPIEDIPVICTMLISKDFVQATTYSGNLKNPRLEELFLKCYYPQFPNAKLNDLHDANADIMFTAKSLQYLVNEGIVSEDGGALKQAKKFVRTHQEILTSDVSSNKARTRSKVKESAYIGHEKVAGGVLKPDFKSVVNIDNYFYGKKVVITGLYDRWPDRSEIARELQILGADVDGGVSARTHILIVGKDAGPKKVEMMNKNIFAGKDAIIIDETELVRLLDQYK